MALLLHSSAGAGRRFIGQEMLRVEQPVQQSCARNSALFLK